MNDTTPEMQERYHRMLMGRSGSERVLMACDMYDTARSLVRASLLAADPDITPAELRQAIFLRFYGRDFEAKETKNILASLK